MNGPAVLPQTEALRLGIEPADPLMAELVARNPPTARVSLRSEVGCQIAGLPGDPTVGGISDRHAPQRRVDLNGGARDEVGDLLPDDRHRLCLRYSGRADAGSCNKRLEHYYPP